MKFDTLNAAFIDPRNLLVTKKYTAVDSTSAITNGSEVRVDIFIKNTSSQPVSDIVLREKIAPYLEVSTDTSTVTIGTKTSDQKALISDEAQEALYDLRSYSLQPGSEMTISYSGNLRPFSF